MFFTTESNNNDIKPELINKGMPNQLNHDVIKECKECDEEISFPKAFAFLKDESHSKSNHFDGWLEPFSSTTHDEQFEEIFSLPYEAHQSSICEENNKTEASNIFYSPSSVTSHHLNNNPYLHLLNMKEAFKGFKFLLPIMKTQFKSHFAHHEPSQHALKIAKQRIASVVLFHGGNLERLKANIGSWQGKISPKRKPSKLFPRLKATVSTYPLGLICNTCENTENFKILQESSTDTTITTEAATGADEKKTVKNSTEFQSVGKCIKGSSAVVEKATKGTVDDDNDATKSVEGFAKKWALDEKMIKDPDPDDTSRKRSLDEVEASVTDKLSSCVSISHGTEKDGILHKQKKTKTTYHCKLCGLPKQKHKCVHLQYLERSIGVMTYPFVDVLMSDEMESIALPSVNAIVQTFANEGALLEHKPSSTKHLKGIENPKANPATMTVESRAVEGEEADLGKLRRIFFNASHVRNQRFIAVGETAESNCHCLYERISVSQNERSTLSRKLFMETINVPYLTEECSLVLQQAQQLNMWDQAVSEIFAQVLTITHCPLGDDSLQGLREYMLTVHGIAC